MVRGTPAGPSRAPHAAGLHASGRVLRSQRSGRGLPGDPRCARALTDAAAGGRSPWRSPSRRVLRRSGPRWPPPPTSPWTGGAGFRPQAVKTRATGRAALRRAGRSARSRSRSSGQPGLRRGSGVLVRLRRPPTVACYQSSNDLAGLTVNALSIDDGAPLSSSYQYLGQRHHARRWGPHGGYFGGVAGRRLAALAAHPRRVPSLVHRRQQQQQSARASTATSPPLPRTPSASRSAAGRPSVSTATTWRSARLRSPGVTRACTGNPGSANGIVGIGNPTGAGRLNATDGQSGQPGPRRARQRQWHGRAPHVNRRVPSPGRRGRGRSGGHARGRRRADPRELRAVR